MKLYLTRHQYDNTFTEDLWAALSEASNKPVGTIMSGWTKQMGFPFIRVMALQEGKDKRVVRVSQQRFYADGTKDEKNPIWMIPIEIATSRSPTTPSLSFVLEGEKSEIILNDIQPGDWFKVKIFLLLFLSVGSNKLFICQMNSGQVGFYRTCYEPELLKELIPAIQHQILPPLDRLGLLDDLFALVKAGHSTTIEIFHLLEAFIDEDHYSVWNCICNVLNALSHLLSYTEDGHLFQSRHAFEI